MQLLRTCLGLLIAWPVALFCLPASAGFPISVVTDANPDAYTGEWNIANEIGFVTGNQTVDLDPGVYNMTVGNQGGMSFEVDGSGNVSPVDAGAAAAAVYTGSTIEFNTTIVFVDPTDYLGLWTFARNGAFAPGPRDVVVVPGLRWQVNVGNADNVIINVAADGAVTSKNTAAATGDPGPVSNGVGSLTFNTSTVTVDPGAYQGLWAFARNGTEAAGSRSLTVVPALRWQVNVGNAGTFHIDVAADGTVTSLNSEAALGDPAPVTDGAGSLMFLNQTVVVEQGSLAGTWQIAKVFASSVDAAVVLVPNLLYQLNADDGSQVFTTTFFLDEPCVDQEVADFPPGSGNSFTIRCDQPIPLYACIGFEPPLHEGPVTVRGSRALPLKAELVDEAGFPVDDAFIAAPPVLQVMFNAASGGSPIDVTGDALSAGRGTEGNQFEFSDGRWRFNLKTDNYGATGDYQLSMASGDVQEYAVDPTCQATFVRD